MKVSLKIAVGSITAMSVLSIAIALVAMGYILNSRMVAELGREQALGLGSIARSNVQNFFELPAKAIMAIQDFVQRPGIMIPGDDPSPQWYLPWEPIIDWPLFLSNYSFLVSYAVLADDSTLRARVYDDKIMNHMYSPPHGPSYLRQIYISNYSDVALQDYYPFPFTDVRGSAFPATQAAATIIGQRKGATFWRAFDAAVFPTEIIKTAFGVLTNNTGAFLGYMCIVTPYTQIDAFLTQAVSGISGAAAVVVDAQSRVVATSMASTKPSRRLVPNITTIYNATTIVGTNCILPNPHDTTRTGACMKNVSTYHYSPLDVTYATFTTLDAVNKIGVQHFLEIEADGEAYYVVVEGLQNSISTDFNLALYLFYPKDHVQSGVRETQTLSIILSAVIAFVVVVASAVITSRLVVPLVHLGSQMTKTANLVDDTSAISDSVLLEISDLEHAYSSMRTQLYKIRQFLPQTIFEPRRNTDANPLDSSEGGSQSGVLPGEAEMSVVSIPEIPKLQVAHSLLEEELNVFVSKRLTVVVVEVFALPDNPAELKVKVSCLMDTLVTNAERYGGVVEQLHPRLTIVTFNAHKPCVLHEERAVNFALRVAPLVRNLGGVIAVDTASQFIGSCGTDHLRARVHFGEGVDVCTKLTGLERHFLRVNLILTERVAQALTSSIIVVPLDIVGLKWAQQGRITEMKVYTARKQREQRQSDTFEGHRNAFLKMLSGDRAGAVEILSTIPTPLDPLTNLLRVRFAYLLEYPQFSMKRMELPGWEAKGDSVASDQELVFAPIEFSPSSPADQNPPGQLDQQVAVRQMLLDRIAGASTAAGEVKTDGLIDMFATTEASPTDDDIPLEIVDIQGTKWIRGKKAMAKGSSGSVFRVLGPRGMLSAAKAISFATESMGNTIEMELSLMSKLRHENVVAYHSCAVLQHHLILFMEFMAGGSVRDVLNEFGCLPADLSRRYFREIVRGLQYLHAHGVVHCDLKPDNVLLTQEGVCKLSDFGSSLTAHMSCADYTQLRGTAAYIAPEVAQGHSPTMASDIWALGVVLAEIVLGDHPFGASRYGGVGSGNFVVMLSRKEVDIQGVIKKLNQEGVPSTAVDVITSCLNYAPERRPTATALLATAFCL